jgi:hypothetical protein
MRSLLVLAAVAWLATGCTAIKATYHVSIADQAVAEASRYGAQERATYEYTMAVRYLEESKEKMGFVQYRTCEKLARKSADWADKALIAAEERKRVDGGIDAEDREGTPSPQPAPQPAPQPVQVDQFGIPIVTPEPTSNIQVDQFGIPIVTPDTPSVVPAPEPAPPPEPEKPKDDYGTLENGSEE